MSVFLRRSPHALLASLCAGVGAANLVRASSLLVAAGAVAFAAAASAATGPAVRVALAAALMLGGWWWGSLRLDHLDRSVLASRIGTAERALVEVTAPVRRGRFAFRASARVLRFGTLRPRERVLLELPVGRAPPQGARLSVLGELREPRGPANGFDERTWLRRQGVHAVLRADRWRPVGRRGGAAGVADRLHAWLARSCAPGLRGERRAVLEGVVLGEDQGLSERLRDDFRASGLYHLLAVSGQNVALVAAGALGLAWLLGVSRGIGEAGALVAIAAYVVAVGPQPSVIRAGVAGVLGSLAWLAARQRDRWYALLLGALALLGWNPYLLLDAGFQLSFAAVVAIFTIAPRLEHALEGYPLPAKARTFLAISTACGVATAPISWLQFRRIPLLAVPANALAAPAVMPLLGLGLVAALVTPVAPSLAAALAWLNGWCAAYLAACARLVAALPFAQVRSTRGAAAVLAGALLAAAYAWSRGRRAEAGLSPHRRRPAEDRARAPAAAPPLRRERGRAALGPGDAGE